MTALRGAFPALVTPLTPQRDVHADDVAALVRRQLADGAAGVLVAGSTGEGTLLEPEQRVELTALARATVDTLDGGGTVVAGASGPSRAALEADVARLAAAGADLVLVLAPHTYPLTEDELVDLHRAVADESPVPTLVYHLPQYTGSWLTPDAVRELAGHPAIAGMKDSSPDPERRQRFLDVTRNTEGFALLSGHAPSLHAALAAGADGSITAIANVRLGQVLALHRAVETGDDVAARREQDTLTRASDALAAVGASLPATLKAALQLDGAVEERWCRPPLRSVPPGRLDHVRTALLR